MQRRETKDDAQTENRLHRDEQRRNVKRFEENLRGFFSVLPRIERRFGEENRMLNDDEKAISFSPISSANLFGRRTKLIFRIDVSPDFLHVVPILDDAVLHRMSDVQQTAILFGFRPDENLALQSPGHHSDVFRSADIVRKVDLRNRIAGETRFDHARTVVNDDWLIGDENFVIHRSGEGEEEE